MQRHGPRVADCPPKRKAIQIESLFSLPYPHGLKKLEKKRFFIGSSRFWETRSWLEFSASSCLAAAHALGKIAKKHFAPRVHATRARMTSLGVIGSGICNRLVEMHGGTLARACDCRRCGGELTLSTSTQSAGGTPRSLASPMASRLDSLLQSH